MTISYVSFCFLLLVALASSESPTGTRQVNFAGSNSNKYTYPSYPYGIGSSIYNPGPFAGLDYGGFPGLGAYPGVGFGGYPGAGIGGYPGAGIGGYPGAGIGGYPGFYPGSLGFGQYPGIFGYGGYPGIGYGGYPGLGFGGINYGNLGYPLINPLFKHS